LELQDLPVWVQVQPLGLEMLLEMQLEMLKMRGSGLGLELEMLLELGLEGRLLLLVLGKRWF
jgi:hypothetical protein